MLFIKPNNKVKSLINVILLITILQALYFVFATEPKENREFDIKLVLKQFEDYAYIDKEWKQEKVFEFILKHDERTRIVEAGNGKKMYLASALLTQYQIKNGFQQKTLKEIKQWAKENIDKIGADLSVDYPK